MSSRIETQDAAFIHPTALLFGRVRIEEGASVWPYAVMRSETAHIRIGRYTNIQDFVMVHTSPDLPVEVGAFCSITHHATLHGCRIGDNCLIGVNATIFDGAQVGNNCIIGQHSYVKDGTVIPDNSIVVGSPAKVIRTQNSWIPNRLNALIYHRNALAYARGEHRAWDGPDFERFVQETLERLHREFEELERGNHAPA